MRFLQTGNLRIALLSLALCGIGLFIAIGMFFATKAVTSGFVRYLKFNMALVKGGLKRE